MLKQIIKRDGRIEDFNPHKLIQWSEWASSTLHNRVDWLGIVGQATQGFGEVANSQDLQKELIRLCLERQDWPHNLMAGRLYASVLRKQFHGDVMPTVKEMFTKCLNAGLMTDLRYTKKEYAQAQEFIDHERDFALAHFQIHQIRKKYGLQNRKTNEEFETPQFTYMRMAMALGVTESKESRMRHVRAWYDHFSLNRINAPTPNYINLGTKLNGYASCCLYKAGDSIESLAIGDHIAYKMTAMSAGIGNYIGTRALGDPVRGGLIEHLGKKPYFRSVAKAGKANMQAGRAGAINAYYSGFDPEANSLTMVQNPRTPEEDRNRDIHFTMMSNRLFAKKVMNDEDIFTFTVYNAPDLTKLFFSGDQDGFEALYNKYDADPAFVKNYVNARLLLIKSSTQCHEVGTHYEVMIDEINRHTSFKEPIYSGNLCVEITQPTEEYHRMEDLYTDGDICRVKIVDQQGNTLELKGNSQVYTQRGYMTAYEIEVGDVLEASVLNQAAGVPYPDTLIVKEILDVSINSEVSMCSIAAIVEPNIHSDEMYASASFYALRMIDKCIHMSDYPLPHVGYTAKQRLNAGVGIVGMAYTMARNHLKYDTPEGLAKIHQIAERHTYFCIEASLRLGEELGNAPWIHKTKWPDGWLPIDTYKRTVDEITPPVYYYPWEELRARIIKNKGIRNSSVAAGMPTESSSKASGMPNAWYAIRELSMKKSDQSNTVDWVAVDSDILAEWYQSAWTIANKDTIRGDAVIQKFFDQALSGDRWKDRSEDLGITTTDLINDYVDMAYFGNKGHYYTNILVSSQGVSQETRQEPVCAGGSCSV